MLQHLPCPPVQEVQTRVGRDPERTVSGFQRRPYLVAAQRFCITVGMQNMFGVSRTLIETYQAVAGCQPDRSLAILVDISEEPLKLARRELESTNLVRYRIILMKRFISADPNLSRVVLEQSVSRHTREQRNCRTTLL